MDQQAASVPEITQLHQIRLDRDLTYDQLAEEIQALGFRMTGPTLQRMLMNPHRKPLDRTLHKVRKYLEAQRQIANAPKGRPTIRRRRVS